MLLAIQNKQYNIFEGFVNHSQFGGTTEALDKRKNWLTLLQSNNNCTNILGMAIQCNDLHAVRMIVEWNNLHRGYCAFNPDNFVWAGNTAIQAALILCGDNFEMIKYLLNYHDPTFKQFNLSYLDAQDPYLVWKVETITYESGYTYERKTREKLKGSITHKPDCEGYTIDERIEMCKESNLLTAKQYRILMNILNEKRLDSLQQSNELYYW